MDAPVNEAPPAESSAPQGAPETKPNAPDWARGSGTLDDLINKQAAKPAGDKETDDKPAPKPDAKDVAKPDAEAKPASDAPPAFDRAAMPENDRKLLEQAERYRQTLARAEQEGLTDDGIQKGLAQDEYNAELWKRVGPTYENLKAQVEAGEITADYANEVYNTKLELETAKFDLEQTRGQLTARDENAAVEQFESEYRAAVGTYDTFKTDGKEGAAFEDAQLAEQIVRALSLDGRWGDSGSLAKHFHEMLTKRDQNTIARERKGIEEAAVARYAGRASSPPSPIYGGSPPATRGSNAAPVQTQSLDQLLHEQQNGFYN